MSGRTAAPTVRANPVRLETRPSIFGPDLPCVDLDPHLDGARLVLVAYRRPGRPAEYRVMLSHQLYPERIPAGVEVEVMALRGPWLQVVGPRPGLLSGPGAPPLCVPPVPRWQVRPTSAEHRAQYPQERWESWRAPTADPGWAASDADPGWAADGAYWSTWPNAMAAVGDAIRMGAMLAGARR